MCLHHAIVKRQSVSVCSVLSPACNLKPCLSGEIDIIVEACCYQGLQGNHTPARQESPKFGLSK